MHQTLDRDRFDQRSRTTRIRSALPASTSTRICGPSSPSAVRVHLRRITEPTAASIQNCANPWRIHLKSSHANEIREQRPRIPGRLDRAAQRGDAKRAEHQPEQHQAKVALRWDLLD
jgi:hypothetical protein